MKKIWIGLVVLFVVVGSWWFINSNLKESVEIRKRKTQKVVVSLKWLHQAQFAGIYIAKEKGWYEDVGMDIEIVEGGVDRPVIQAVLSGEADFGVAGGDDLIKSVSEGGEIKAIAAIYQNSPRILFVKQGSDIENLKDFIGKTVGLKQGTGTDTTYRAMMVNEGLDTSRVNEVSVDYDLKPFYEDKVDIWMGFIMNEPVEAEKNGYPVRLIKPSDYGVDQYSDVLVAKNIFISNNPEFVGKFVEATLRGWNYALNNIDETAEIVTKYSDNEVEFEKNFLKLSADLIKPNQSMKVGDMNYLRWNQTYETLLAGGVLSSTIDVSKVYTREFIID